MPKNARQEITFVLGGQTFTVRPDFAYINRLETALGIPARVLGMRCLVVGSGQEEITLSQMAAIMWAAVGGTKGAPATYTDLGDILMEDGYGDYLKPFGEMLAGCLVGHKDHTPDPVKEVATGALDPSPENQTDPTA